MPAPTMSHVICTAALIVLIFVMQFSYFYVVDNISAEMTRRELKEIADYVSDTLANLYFLVNSTNRDIALQKTLDLPSDIRGSTYLIEIAFNETPQGKFAQHVHACIKDKSRISATSWLLPGLRVGNQTQVESGKTVVAGCRHISTSVYVWIAYEV